MNHKTYRTLTSRKTNFRRKLYVIGAVIEWKKTHKICTHTKRTKMQWISGNTDYIDFTERSTGELIFVCNLESLSIYHQLNSVEEIENLIWIRLRDINKQTSSFVDSISLLKNKVKLFIKTFWFESVLMKREKRAAEILLVQKHLHQSAFLQNSRPVEQNRSVTLKLHFLNFIFNELKFPEYYSRLFHHFHLILLFSTSKKNQIVYVCTCFCQITGKKIL